VRFFLEHPVYVPGMRIVVDVF